MRLFRLLLLASPIAWGAVTQVVCALGSGASAYKAASDQRPTGDALQLSGRAFAAAKTLCGANCPQVVLFRNSTSPNLMMMPAAGQAKIVYAPQVFEAVYEHYGDAGIIALLAHEIGHALDDAIGVAWIDQKAPVELRADGFAGCILARAAVGADELPAALAALEEFPSRQHPAWSLRLAALRAGYNQCGGAK